MKGSKANLLGNSGPYLLAASHLSKLIKISFVPSFSCIFELNWSTQHLIFKTPVYFKATDEYIGLEAA
jgi:hypothetical protein